MNHRGTWSSKCDGVMQGPDSELARHTGVGGIADDAVGEDVLHDTAVELSLPGAVLGDVGEPQLVRGIGGEVPFDEVVVDRRSGAATQAPFLRVSRPKSLLGAQAPHPVLRGPVPQALELVGDEAIAEGRVVVVHVDRGVGQIGVVEVPSTAGPSEPLEIALLGELEHPAGHRHGNAFGGKVTDQRVSHFGELPWDR